MCTVEVTTTELWGLSRPGPRVYVDIIRYYISASFEQRDF